MKSKICTNCSAFISLFLSILLILSLFPANALNRTPASAEETTEEKLNNAQAQLDAVQKQLETLQVEAQDMGTKLSQTMDEIENVNKDIAKKEEEVAKKQDTLGNRMAAKYKSGDNNMVDVILSSTSMFELFNNWFYVQKILENEAGLIQDVKNAKEELNSKKSELEDLKTRQGQELSNLQDKQAQTTTLINSLNDEVKELMAQRDAEIVAAAQAAAAAAAASSSGGGSYATGPRPSRADSSKGQAIVDACFTTPSPGAGWCAAWVSQVYARAGVGYIGGNACDMYYSYCHSSDRSTLQAGMIIATPTNPPSADGIIYGHVGIYVGDGLVMDNVGRIRTSSLDAWIAECSKAATVRWGWA